MLPPFMNAPRLLLSFAILASVVPCQLLEAGIVTTTADSGSGSLRAAISAAVNGETITFAPGLNGATITLTSGSLFITGFSSLTIDATSLSSGISISGNNSSRALTIYSNSNITLRKLTLKEGREANESGGALYAQGGQLVMTDCSVIGSYAETSGGGAVIVDVTQATLDRCSFIGNHGKNYGGGVYFIGSGSDIVTISNSVIAGNRSLNGGGILSFDVSPTIINCTIQGNSGAGIRNEFSSAPVLRNTIVWGNRIDGDPLASQQIQSSPSSTASANVNHCLVEGALATLNNLDGTLTANNPKFISPANPANSPSTISDLRVFTDSPVINVGNNASNSTSLDRSGRTRVQNTTIDLGAFEGGYVSFAFLHPSLVATEDANGNGLSNFLEYATGIDPTAPDNSSVRPQISTSGGFRFLTSSQRSNGVDSTAIWQTSTTLAFGSWQNMLLGINYTVDSLSNPTPNRQQVVLKLLDADSRRFYRQGFSSDN